MIPFLKGIVLTQRMEWMFAEWMNGLLTCNLTSSLRAETMDFSNLVSPVPPLSLRWMNVCWINKVYNILFNPDKLKSNVTSYIGRGLCHRIFNISPKAVSEVL